MSKKVTNKPWSEQCVWYITLICGFLFLVSLVPVVPWRYSKMDAAMGARFSEHRSYSLMGATDQFGSRQSWLGLSKKIQRKVEEFTRPNPTGMLLGTVSSMSGAGGAALGCATWELCKTHVKARYNAYWNIGVTGIISMICLIFALFSCVGTLVLYSFEDAQGKKKTHKKKKKSDGCDLSAMGKTALAAGMSFFFSLCGTFSFVIMLDVSLKGFKKTAHYPYAASHAGAYIAGAGSILMFFVMLFYVNRVRPCCGNREGGGEYGKQFGGGEWGPGAYGPPGGYAGPPGGYAGPPGGYYGKGGGEW